ncbi:glycosyltransferase [bacterium]|nr:MAG: glycosyltransferase [bacterium]
MGPHPHAPARSARRRPRADGKTPLSFPVSGPRPIRVCAIVVTFNRQVLLKDCLRALLGQGRPLDTILVVDNASTDGTGAMLQEEFPAATFPTIEVLSLPKNSGGAGGFHAGMKHAYEGGFDWLWLMDDDGTPAPDCLQLLLDQAPDASGKNARVMVPMQQDRAGRKYGVGLWDKFYSDVSGEVSEKGEIVQGDYLFAFVGPLIAREVVNRIGLPRRNFFIWFDDYEYGLRLHRSSSNAVTVVPGAVFHHDIGGQTREVRLLGRRALRNDSPAWKTYYGTRNHLFTVLRTRRNLRETGWFLVREGWLIIGDLLFEADRWKRVGLRLRGLNDGLFGFMGKRV